MVSKKELRARFAIARATAELHTGFMEDALLRLQFNKALGELEIVKVHLAEAERLKAELNEAEESQFPFGVEQW